MVICDPQYIEKHLKGKGHWFTSTLLQEGAEWSCKIFDGYSSREVIIWVTIMSSTQRGWSG